MAMEATGEGGAAPRCAAALVLVVEWGVREAAVTPGDGGMGPGSDARPPTPGPGLVVCKRSRDCRRRRPGEGAGDWALGLVAPRLVEEWAWARGRELGTGWGLGPLGGAACKGQSQGSNRKVGMGWMGGRGWMDGWGWTDGWVGMHA